VDIMTDTHAQAPSAAVEPTCLLCTAKVEALKVRSRDGDALGTVHSLMVNKRTGQSTYAVLSLGGFLGMGKSFYPLPFQLIAYDELADGYIVTIDRRVLEGGPSWSNNAPEFNQAYADRVSNYYGVPPADLSLA
jgi:hypothetical protein